MCGPHYPLQARLRHHRVCRQTVGGGGEGERCVWGRGCVRIICIQGYATVDIEKFSSLSTSLCHAPTNQHTRPHPTHLATHHASYVCRYASNDKRSKLPQWVTQFLPDAHINLTTDMAVHVSR